MYQPHSYTHQGVGASIRDIRAGKYLRYPGKIGSDFYDRAMLRKILLPVVRFQKQYGARIYCGEFSVIRWAPGGAQYLEDLCSLFEEFGWGLGLSLPPGSGATGVSNIRTPSI